MSETWDSAPLAPAPTGTWDAAPLAGPTTQQKAVLSADSNGEEAARALQIGKKTGIPATVVQSDLPGYDAHERQQSAKRAVQNPAIAKYIDGSPMAARVSGDDYDHLDEVSQTLQALHPDLIKGKASVGVFGGIAEVNNLLASAPGRQKLLDALKELPAAIGKGLLDFVQTPGKVASGEINLTTPGGLDQGIGFGIGVALGTRDIRAGRTGDLASGVSSPADVDAFLARVRGAKTRQEIDAFIASKQEGPPGAMLQIEHAKAGSAALDKAVEVAQDSKTKARSPELFAEAAAAHDPGNVHIDAQKIVELYEKEGKVPAEGDGLFGFVPGLAEKAQAAAATGGEVTIPVADYIAHIDPTVHEGLKEDIRLHDDGVTLTEAKESESDKALLYHGSLTDTINTFNTGTHFGTREAAEQRIKDLQETPDESRYPGQVKKADERPTLYQVNYAPKNPIRLSDQSDWAPIDVASDLKQRGLISDEEFAKLAEQEFDFDPFELLASKGYDAIEYMNEHEHKGSTSYILLKELPANKVPSVEDQIQAKAKIEKRSLGLDTNVFLNMIYKDQKALNITPAEFKKYSDLIARQEQAVLDKAVSVSKAYVAQALTPEWKRNEAAVTTEVSNEFRAQGVFAAERYLRQNKIEMRGDNVDQIADDLAPLWGFPSGNALRDALTDMETIQAADRKSPQVQEREAIKAEVARRMEERYGNLAQNIAKEARQIALADHAFDVLAAEVRILADAAEIPPPLSRTELVDWATAAFEERNIRDAANWTTHQRTVAKGGREVEKALLKGDYREALVLKQEQFLAAVWAKESLALQGVVDRAEKKIDRFSSEQVIASIDQAHLEQLRQMLASVGLPQQFAPLVDTPALRDFVDLSEGQIAVTPWLMDGSQPKLQDMSVGEFRDFVKSMQSLEHAGRDALKLTNAMGEAALQNVVFDAAKSMSRFPKIDQPNRPSTVQRLQGYGRMVLGAHLLVERVLDYTDQFDPHGPLTEWLDRPLRDANTKEIALTEKVVKMLRELRQYTTTDTNARIENNLIPDALDKTGFLRMTHHELRTLMLNMGNWSNIKKAANGFGVNEADLRRMIDREATAADVAYVNGIWKVFEALKPEADAVQFRDTGVPVDSIPAVPWEVKAGALNGGYYPLSYDPYNSDIQGHIAQPLFDKGYHAATTPHRYTLERTEYEGAIDLTGTFLNSKIRGMVHDIAFREAVRNADKLIKNQEFRTAVAQYWGKEVADLLPGWIRDIANSHNLDDNYARDLVRVSALIRQNVVSTLIAFNPGTFIKHGFTALVMSMDRVGIGSFAEALKDLGVGALGKNAKELIWKSDSVPDEAFLQAFRDALDQGERGENARQFVLQSSPVMRNRQRQWDESIFGAIQQIQNAGVPQTLAEFRQRAMQFGRFAVAYSDQFSAYPTWLAAYKKAFAAGEAPADAAFIADKEVSRAHGSSFVGDKPRVSRAGNDAAGEFTRWFTSLYNFWNHQTNNLFSLVWDMSAKLGGREEPGANYASLSRRWGYIAGIIMIEEMASAAKDEDHKSLGMKALAASVRYFGGGFVGLREVTNAMASGYEPSTGMIGTLFKAMSDTYKDIAKSTGVKAGVAKNWIIHTATLLGMATGVGGTQIGKTTKGAAGQLKGTERPRTFNDLRQLYRTGSTKARTHH